MTDLHIHGLAPRDKSGAAHITVSFPQEWGELLGALIREARPDHDKRIDTIVATMKELLTMSNTISQQQDANTTKLTADLDTIKTGVANLQAQLAAGQGAAGTTITQAQEDALAAAVATADALAAAFAPASAVPVFNSADTTPNGSLMADGVTVRNTPGLSGFDATKPETT